jgi:hypothetical protein
LAATNYANASSDLSLVLQRVQANYSFTTLNSNTINTYLNGSLVSAVNNISNNPSPSNIEAEVEADVLSPANGFTTFSFRTVGSAAGYPVYRHALLVALRCRVQFITYEDAQASSDITVLADSVPSRLNSSDAQSSLTFSGDSGASRLLSVDGSSDVVFDALATPRRDRDVAADSDIIFSANIVPTIVTIQSFKPFPRWHANFGDLFPLDMAEVRVIGDEVKKNRLYAISNSQLQTDPLYTGSSYTLASLGFKAGDRLFLTQAQGFAIGLNNLRELTIVDPASMEVFELLQYPDIVGGIPIAYKFYAIKRA